MVSAPKTQEEARTSALRSVLRELNATSADIEASACISSDGFSLAAVLGDGVDPDRFGAIFNQFCIVKLDAIGRFVLDPIP